MQKTDEKIDQAQFVLFLVENSRTKDIERLKREFEEIKNKYPQKTLLVIMNKMDLLSENEISYLTSEISNLILRSAKNKEGIDALKNQLMRLVNTGALRNNETIVTNTRHYDSLLKALERSEERRVGK